MERDDVLRAASEGIRVSGLDGFSAYVEIPGVHRMDDHSFLVSMNNSHEKRPVSDGMCSYIDFLYDPGEKGVEDIDIRVEEPARRSGVGEKLVLAMSETCRSLGGHYVHFYNNLEPGFWKAMGFEYQGSVWEIRF